MPPVALTFEAPAAWLGIESLSGHLTGVPVPAGGTVTEVVYTPTSATVYLSGVPCGPGVAPAFVQSLGPAGYNRVKTPELVRVQHQDGRSIYVRCEVERGVDMVSLTSEGAMGQGWNPWNVPSWRVGPFSVLPDVSTGPTYKPHSLRFRATQSIAELTPKNPSPFIQSLGAALTEAGWTPRPLPAGTAWSIRDDTMVVSKDGARVDLRLYKSP
ncbi:MAG: hypothetical protein AB8H79_02470 [Myxococcota bacterium]